MRSTRTPHVHTNYILWMVCNWKLWLVLFQQQKTGWLAGWHIKFKLKDDPNKHSLCSTTIYTMPITLDFDKEQKKKKWIPNVRTHGCTAHKNAILNFTIDKMYFGMVLFNVWVWVWKKCCYDFGRIKFLIALQFSFSPLVYFHFT